MQQINSCTKGMLIAFILCFTIINGYSISKSSARYDLDSNKPSVLITVGDYQVKFTERYSWTFREINYQDKQILTPTGAHQPVVKEREVPNGADKFLGTGHRPEQIELVEIIVLDANGQVVKIHPVDNTLDISGNYEYVFHKKSKFLSEVGGLYYLHESKITIGKNGIKQDYYFEAVADDYSNLDFMYAFMHCFDKKTTHWRVGNDTEVTDEGEFLSDNSFTLRKDIRFCQVYAPDHKVGISILYPVIYKGVKIKNAFWNRTRDNKHYLMVEPGKKRGEKFSYSAEIKAFKAKNYRDFSEKSNAILKRDL